MRELEDIAGEATAVEQNPPRLGISQPEEYGSLKILRAHASSVDATFVGATLSASLDTSGFIGFWCRGRAIRSRVY